jgi:TolB protein
MAFVSDRDGNAEIYVMNADGSAQRRLTRDPASDADPVWSPDGQKIAFVNGAGQLERSGVYVMNADGSGQRRLTRRGE